jgi:large subunit ribosomal protein L2
VGKYLKMQRRGKGSNAYAKPSHRFKADVMFRQGRQQLAKAACEVIEFVDNPMHSAPLMRVRYEDNSENVLIAPEGIKIGDKIFEGKEASVGLGNILRIGDIPEGLAIYNLEAIPGDGGKYIRAAGSFATVVSHSPSGTTVLLPSKRSISIDNECRAEIGVVSGGGMEMQPILKAGKNYYIKHATNQLWPRYRGVKMNPVDHPFGGKQHHKGFSSMVSRNAPPGRKVGHLAASRVGRKKR